MRAQPFLALPVSVIVLLLTGRDAGASCRIYNGDPTGPLPTTPAHSAVGQVFSFFATTDCTSLTFTAGTFRASPVLRAARGPDANLYTVGVPHTDWKLITEPASPTLDWTVHGVDAATAADAYLMITNDLDTDRDGVTRAAGDCNDYDRTVGPDAIDVCGNGIDDDCDGTVDECLTDVHIVVHGTSGGSYVSGFGGNVAVGDLNGDGVADLLTGTAQFDGNQGQANVFYGRLDGPRNTNDSPILTEGPSPYGEELGWAVSVGDLDGDGYDDALVAAPLNDRAYLFAGPVESGVTSGATAPLVDPAVVYSGPELTGMDVDIVPDVDGDGACDVVIGSARAGHTSVSGAAYVTSCTNVGNVDLTTESTYKYYGDATGYFGYASTTVGDQNGDGITDLAFGDSGSAVYVVEGGDAAGEYDVDAVAAATISESGPWAAPTYWFGETIVSTDYDGDGTADLLVGSPGADASGDRGRVFGFLGPFAGALDLSDAEVVWSYGPLTSYEGAGIGWDVAAGDADGDGETDIAFGAPFASTEESGVATLTGAVYIQRGLTSGEVDVRDLVTIPGLYADGDLGTAVAFVPDWDGDGGDELAIGSTRVDHGLLYVLSSRRVF